MKKEIITVLCFTLSSISCFSQEPPDRVSLYFINNLKQKIHPQIHVVGSNIGYNKDRRRLEVTTSAFDIDSSLKIVVSQNDSWRAVDRWTFVNSELYFITSPTGNHSLDAEVKIIAEYEKKKMVLLFVGGGYSNFGTFDMKRRIEFQAGTFLYFNLLRDGKDSIIRMNVPENFSMISDTLPINIDTLKNFQGKVSEKLLPFEQVLEYNQRYFNDKMYMGFLFENCVPIGFAWIEDKNKQIIMFNKQFIRYLKEYYQQHSICTY